MKTILAYIYHAILRFLLSLRYRIKVKGLENLPPDGGLLFLANHPAEIDPCILLAVLWKKFHIRPIAIDYLFRIPGVRYLLDFVGALSIPNFDYSSNSFKRRQIDKTYEQIYTLLKQKENLLIYPAGGLKNEAPEVIGGASGVHTILQNAPHAQVVLVRTSGLWGSSFSRALTGKTPDLMKAFLNGLLVVLKNGIFFAPRREVVIECALAPADFPHDAGRRELNRYLENWYNAPVPEPMNLVSYSFWRKELAIPFVRPKQETVSIAEVPGEVKEKVFAEIATLTKLEPEKISADHNLATDLGLDSLDIAQLVVALKEEYGVTGVQSTDLVTVGSVCVYAARLKEGKLDEEEEDGDGGLWDNEKDRPLAVYPEGETLIEGFLNTADKLSAYVACVDKISGEVPYKRLKLGVVLLAQAIKKLPGERIGIMMPASTAVNAVILATMLAGKVPVMINWTLGERNLRSIVEQSGIEVTLSSWAFIDRLDNIELNGLDDQIVLLEEVRRDFTPWQKLTAFLRARKKPEALMKTFGSHRVKKDDTAVILFTSGTESYPKGVPLSHHNIMSNHRGAYTYVDVQKSDVMLGSLPPFHSFGFSVTGLFPLLSGMRVAYSPNPTDGRRMALAIARWKVTILCSAPTFLKNLLRVSDAQKLSSLRLVVSGAERAPADLFDKLADLNPHTCIIEGYGITECAPILTLNPPHKPTTGVGVPLPGIELKIVHPETGESTTDQGLILARGPNIFHGYLDPNLPSPFVESGGKQWYQTGDLGFINGGGYLTLSGRLKRFIKIGGEMVSLGAVEEALIQSAPNMGWELDPENPSIAICALEHDGKKSEMHLFTTVNTTSDEVNKALRDSGMSNLIKVRSVRQIPFIPLLGTGKIDYKKLSTTLEEK